MLVCLDCGNVFDEEDIEYWDERHGLDYGPYEHCSGCPDCGGAYTEAIRCDGCGEWITNEYVEIGDERYCENCFTVKTLGDN